MKISVIIPFYNLAPYVRVTLDSVVAAVEKAKAKGEGEESNSPLAVEVICVDDGSTDETPDLLDAYVPTFNLQPSTFSLRVIHKPNGGEGSARNAGIGRSTGEYLMYLDGDDVLLPNALAVAVGLARCHPDADIVSMRYALFDDGGRLPESVDTGAECEYDLRREVPSDVICRLGVFPTLFRQSALGALRFSDLPLGADREYVMAALAKADVLVWSDAVVEGYRIRPGSMARAQWTDRKIRSLNDHACRGLRSLAECGRRIGRDGADYLASLVVSEVPARIARLSATQPVGELASHWQRSVRDLPVRLLSRRLRAVRRLTLVGSRSWRVAVTLARLCRAMGLA